jgi:DHA2 family methylenomycin A resistance protein-like MFS transporter
VNDLPSAKQTSIAWTIAAASFGFAVVQLDVTIVNVALPRLSVDLAASVPGLQWVVDAYSLVFAVLLLSAGVMGDRLGARRAYLIGLAGFALASAACGAAQTAGELIAARAVQGIGAALLVPPSLALINHACAHDAKLRAKAIGFWTAAAGVSIAAGPIVGGLLLGWLGWRSIFFVNLPLCALGMAITLRVAETPRKPQQHLDLRGQLLAIATLTCLTAAVIEIGPRGLGDPLVLGGLALAVIGALLFIRVESRAAQPMLPLRFFRLPNFSPAVMFGISVNLTYYGLIFILSLYLQHVCRYTATQAGLAFLPLTATFAVANLISGWMAGHYGSRSPMLLGAMIGATGFALLTRLDASSSYIAMLAPFVLIPSGMGLGVPAMTTAILASVEKTFSGTASAVLNAARQSGGAIGVAAFGALVTGGDGRIVPGMHTAAWLSSALLASAAVVVWFGIRRQVSPANASIASETHL